MSDDETIQQKKKSPRTKKKEELIPTEADLSKTR